MKKRFNKFLTLLAVLLLGFGQMWAEEEIIKVVLSGSNGSTQTMSGTIGGTCAVDKLGSSSPYKLSSNGAYVSLTLSTGYFEPTDIVTITGADGAHQIYYGTPTSGTLLCTTGAPSSGTITCKLKGLPANQNTIYLYRASDTYNKKVATMAVTRPDPLPVTGTASVTYSLISNSANVEGEATVSTITADDASSFTTSTLTVTSGNKKDGYSGQIKGFTAISEYNASYYVALSFSVASGYTFEPSAASLTIFANSCTPSSKVVISDGETTIESNTLTCSSSADAAITFAAGTFTAGKKFSGDVTIKVYFWGASGDKRAYIKSPVTITGTVAAAASATAPAITAPTTDQSASYTVGDAITALSVTATGTPTPTYQWYSNASASTTGATLITGAESASYTPSNAVVSDLYYYCVATNSEGNAQSPYFHVTVSAAVVTAPSFTSPASEPAAAEYHVGDVISALEVVAAGYPTPTLQWYSNTSKSTEGATALTGEDEHSYTPSNAAASNLYYYCVATNSEGTARSEYFHVTVSPIPTHAISYTNLKGADNSANPTEYTEGVGVASFAKLRHVVGFDFTGWDPSSISSSATTDQTIDAQWSANPVAEGTGTLTYNLGYSDNTIATSSITRNNGALYDATDLTWAGVTIDNSQNAERSGKITTTTSYDGDKYLSLTFKIADGYTFTPTEVQLKAVAVSHDKTIRFEFTDNSATPNTKYLEQTRANGSSVGTLTYDFDASDPVVLKGTVTVKIYAYGNTDKWRLGTPITITGTVDLDCTKPGTPANLAVSEKSHNSAKFGWDAAANADGYKVRLEQGSTIVVDWTDCASTSYTKDELTPETAYTFKVKAKGATGYCELGGEASVNVTTDAAPSANPVITGAVNEDGWGSVSPASITVTSGNTVSITDNVLTCGGQTLTATATTATDEYTYAFVNWTGVADGDAVIANVTATANFSRTANSYDLAWDKNAEDADALTGDYTNGSTPYGTTIVKPNKPTRTGYKFLGWAETSEGAVVEVPATMPAEAKSYYAKWQEVNCPTSGTLFSLEMKTGLPDEKIAAGANIPMTSSYATITGGSATLYNAGTDNTKAQIYQSNMYLGGAAGYVLVELDCPLQEKDVIAFTGSSDQICFTLTAARNTTYSTSAGEFEVTSAFLGGSGAITTFYVWRASGNGTSIHSLTVTRPAPDAPTPTITTNPASASYAASDPILPMTVVAEATGTPELHYQWYKVGDPSDVEVGTDAASYTPTGSGEYYCVVTNSPSGFTPKSATSAHATITMISSDATLAWIKAGDVNIALSAGVYDYEYTLPYDYAAATAPVITVETNDANANAEITQAATKTGTATIHVVAQDNVTVKDYSVKFNEYSGCMDEFYFAKADDADANSVKQNEHGFFSNMQSDGSDLAQTFTIDAVDYTVTRSTSSKGSFGKLTIPAGLSANVYVGLKTTGERTVTLEPESGTKYDVVVPQSDNAVAEFTDVAAGVYTIKVSSNCNFAVVKAHICKFAVTGVSLPATESVLVGKTVTLTPVFTPTYASNKNVTWASDAEGVATVANGVVTGVSAGTANITVTTVDGGFKTTCAVTVSAMDCNTFIGNLFSFAVVATENKQYEEVGEGSNEKEIGAEVATVESGAAYVGHTSSSATIDVANKQSGVWYFKFGDSNTYLRIELSCALQTGDIISLTSLSQNFYISTTAAYPSDAANRIEIPANGEYVVLHGDILDGADEIYVWRKSGSTYLKTLSIDRNTPDYKRTVNPAYLGTLCWTNNAILGGATLFELAGKNESNYLVFDEVTENRLEAGKPYIFLPDNGKTEINLFNTDDAAPLTEDQDPVNHMYGTITGKTLVPGVDDNMYYFSSSHIWAVKDFTANISVPAYYCYVDYDAVLAGAPASAPAAGRRRVTMGVNGKDAAQGFENILGGDQPMKVMIDGTLYIIRGEKVFDATGRLVK